MTERKASKEGDLAHAARHHFVDRIRSKLRLRQREGRGGSGGGSGGSGGSSGSASPLLEPSCSPSCQLLSPEGLAAFSDHLKDLLGQVAEVQTAVTSHTGLYPRALQDKLDEDAKELSCIYREVRAAAVDVDRIRKQREAVRREKHAVKKCLKTLKDEEVKELEATVLVAARPLYNKWEAVKNTQKPEVLENFLNEVAGKHEATDILQGLIERRISKLRAGGRGRLRPPEPHASNTSNQSTASTLSALSAVSAVSNLSAVSAVSTASTASNSSGTAPTWPLPTLPVDKTSRPPSDRELRVCRRKRLRETRERRHAPPEMVRPPGAATAGGVDLHLAPLGTDSPRRSPSIINIEYAFGEDSVSLSHSDRALEVRDVLETIFGELQLPQLTITARGGTPMPPHTAALHR